MTGEVRSHILGVKQPGGASKAHKELATGNRPGEISQFEFPGNIQKGEIEMAEILTKNWWLVVLRGVLAILFGIVAFVWPGTTLEVLVLFFGAYALADGIFSIAAGI